MAYSAICIQFYRSFAVSHTGNVYVGFHRNVFYDNVVIVTVDKHIGSVGSKFSRRGIVQELSRVTDPLADICQCSFLDRGNRTVPFQTSVYQQIATEFATIHICFDNLLC